MKDIFELERAQLEGVQKTRENKESSRKHGLKGNIEQIWILWLKAEEKEDALNSPSLYEAAAKRKGIICSPYAC